MYTGAAFQGRPVPGGSIRTSPHAWSFGVVYTLSTRRSGLDRPVARIKCRLDAASTRSMLQVPIDKALHV